MGGGGGAYMLTSDPTVQGTVKTILWHKTPSRLGERQDMKVGGARWGSVRLLRSIQTVCTYEIFKE